MKALLWITMLAQLLGSEESTPGTEARDGGFAVNASLPYLLDDLSCLPATNNPLGDWIPFPRSAGGGVADGDWRIADGRLQAVTSPADNPNGHYAILTHSQTWSGNDYSVEARIQFQTNAFGGGIGGRVNANTGSRYAAWVYPEGSPMGDPDPRHGRITLVRYNSWHQFVPLGQATLDSTVPAVGTNCHTLKLEVRGHTITASFDGKPYITRDDSSGACQSGGVSLECWAPSTHPANISAQFISVSKLPTELQGTPSGEAAALHP